MVSEKVRPQSYKHGEALNYAESSFYDPFYMAISIRLGGDGGSNNAIEEPTKTPVPIPTDTPPTKIPVSIPGA